MRRHTAALALAALTAMMIPAAVDAQTPRQGDRDAHAGRMGAGQPAERILELRQELGLTEEQVAGITRIQAELRSKNEPLREQLAAARQAMQTRHEQMTPEQRESMRAQMQARRETMRDSMQARQRTPGMQARREAMRDSMQARRGQMTPEQRAQMRERMGAGMESRRDGAVRPRAGQAAGMGMMMPEELRPVMEQMRSNTETAMQQIRATLTAEQQAKLRELHAERRPAGRGARGAR